MEMEHTASRRFARKIASDHIKDFGCGYYPRLKKLERALGRRK